MVSEHLINKIVNSLNRHPTKVFDSVDAWEMGEECRILVNELNGLLVYYKGKKDLIHDIAKGKSYEFYDDFFFPEWKQLYNKYPELDEWARRYAKLAEKITWKTVYGTANTHDCVTKNYSHICSLTSDAKNSGVFGMASDMYYGTICLYYRPFLSLPARKYGDNCYRWLRRAMYSSL